MSNQDKIYVGGAKEKTGNYGVFHSISFSAQDIATLQSNLNAKGYVNLNMNQRQSPSQYGQTHSLTIDTWQPTPQGQAPQQQAPQQNFQPQPNQTYQTENVQPPPFNQSPPNFQQGAPIPPQFQQ